MAQKNTMQNQEDRSLDAALRPQKWSDYIGQEKIKRNLKIILGAAKERKEPAEHLLFYGPAGLGKTTLAHIIAKELNAPIRVTSGPAIERVGDIASILTNLSVGEILFVDEAHRLNKMIEEILYPAMESGFLNIVIGKGPSARTLQLDLPPFTLIAATTRIALLSSPLRSRFSGGIFKLEFYTNEEIKEIIKKSAKIINIKINEEASEKIAERSRSTPRVANRLLKRCRDYAQINKKGEIDASLAEETLCMLEIDSMGLENTDKKILQIIIEKFNGGPVGLQTLSAAASEDIATIEEIYEPYLIQLGFMERTPRGRIATANAYEHLGISKNKENKLL